MGDVNWRIISVAALACLGVTGCTGGRTADPGEPQPTGTAAPVKVQRGSIDSVVTATGSLTAGGRLAVLSAAAGVLTHPVAPAPRTVTRNEEIGRVGGIPIVAPADGTLTWQVADGQGVVAAQPVAFVATTRFVARSPIPADVLYRVYSNPVTGRAQIVNGPGPFDCDGFSVAAGDSASADAAPPAAKGDAPTASSTSTKGGSDSGPPSSMSFMCVLPPAIAGGEGVAVIVAASVGGAKNALLVPALAVAGTKDSGQVRLADGQLRDVKLGVTDGTNVQILSGLAEGDEISSQAPNLRRTEQ